MPAHVSHLSCTCFSQLRNRLSAKASRLLVQAFVSCRLDYCNSLLLKISDAVTDKLQRTQNAATRLLTVALRADPVSATEIFIWGPIAQGA